MQDPDITPELIADHGLTEGEYDRILDITGRTPSFTELGIYSAMWNEHCSYKSSRKWLRTLHTTGPQVICGPGENAGVVDIGDGQAVIFKMESHNHPSFIDPYHGAATGVGGILRDVFTMGARPFAAMNALSFGRPEHPRTAELLSGAVSGIADYARIVGVPMAGGEVRFNTAYDGNCLVNAFAAGLAATDSIFYAAASGVGMPVVYVGARTGREGVGSATRASAEFDNTLSDQPEIQKGDPETERRLMEACLELMATGAVISIQDMGAAGLTCSAVEMGDKGGLGIRLDLDHVPVSEDGMTAYEMMLSESQERMLMVLHPEKEAEARKIFQKWELDFAIVGETLEEDRFLVMHGNTVKADLPLSKLSSQAPEYDRPWTPSPEPTPLDDLPEIAPIAALEALISSPNYACKSWIWQQFSGDALTRGPGHGAGVVQLPDSRKALAFTSDVTPRYVQANPVEGGRQAVAEAWRNLIACGATPLAATDNLNFGNPERPEIMGQLVGSIQGIAEACEALDFPIVSGNVSLYNETDGQAILPTPTIGGVGLIANLDDMIGTQPQPGNIALLIGPKGSHLGASALAVEAFGIEYGDAPPVNLVIEGIRGRFVLDHRQHIIAATDLSDGGLALAAFEMAAAGKTGLTLDTADIAELFGEDQGRYLLACDEAGAKALEEAARFVGIPVARVGHFGGDQVDLGGDVAALSDLLALYQNSFAESLGLF